MTEYERQLLIVKLLEDDLRNRGANLMTEIEARAASGHTRYESQWGDLDLEVLRSEHNNERDWLQRTLAEAERYKVPEITPEESAAANLAEAGDLSAGTQPVGDGTPVLGKN